VDCLAEGITTPRPIATGTRKKRCATHSRAVRKRSQLNAHGRTVQTTYGITQEQYWALYEAQGGRCALCAIATGKTKRLAVEHDHDLAKIHDHPVDQGCPDCVRGLCCGRCNRYGVPLNKAAIVRALNYLHDPPARKVLARFAELDV
jgi:hypothetical protein